MSETLSQILTKISKKLIFFILIPLVSKFDLDFQFRNYFLLFAYFLREICFLEDTQVFYLKNNQIFYLFYFLLHPF